LNPVYTTVLEHTGSPLHRSMVAISGDIVVWEDWRNNGDSSVTDPTNVDIYGYNMARDVELALVTDVGNQLRPSIDGTRLVWYDEGVDGAAASLQWMNLPVSLTGFCDFNGDGLANLLDINPFVLAITNESEYAIRYPNVVLTEADPNGDGIISLLDINPFVHAVVTGGAGSALPEPAAATMLLFAGVCMVYRRRRRR